jgi:UDP-3-O-[3-hydroxymyristoyl] glucosamine N-acyltransferase
MPFSALQAAEWCGGKIEGAPGQLFDSMESMELAGANQMTFIGTAAYGRKFDQCPAGGAVCREGLAVSRRVDQTLIIVPDADLAVAEILGRLAPLPPYPPAGIHPTAVIDDSASVGAGVRIGPYCVVQAGATIGEHTVLMAQSFVGRESQIGQECVLWPQVVIREGCRIGNRVVLHSGCVIGADGFGYRFASGRHVKIPQIGGVVVEDDCELGANTTVDRGKFSNTIIGQGSKLDNLVQVGHNVQLGKHTILVAHVAVGGSVKAGDYLVAGGGAVVADHQTIGPGAQVAGFSAVVSDLAAGDRVVGAPARPGKQYFSELRALHKLPALVQKIQQLEQRITELESSTKNNSQ